VSNRKKVKGPKRSNRPGQVCPGCQRGEHPHVPHCMFCAAIFPRTPNGYVHPEPVCPEAAVILAAQSLS
jgi:hypothetical protein